MRTVYVYSAVPPNSKGTIEEYGLLSGVEVAKNKEILKLARPTKKSREDLVKKVEATAASDRPYPVLGPSVLFTMPDESKITDKHFIKEWGLIPVRINLSKLMEDYPETMIWGAELLPIKDKWNKLSDEAFDRKIEKEYGLTWEEFLEARSHELTLANVRKYSKMQPKTLWSNYERQSVGKYYAANVPHAFIITPMGNIPYAYVEFMNPRENPLDEYTQTLYHCSPTVIDKIDPNSPNGEFMGTLFFASGYPYSPGLCDYVYKLTMTYDQIIHIRNLEPTDDELQEIIRMVDAYCGFDKLNADQAYELLTEVYSEDLFVAYMGGDECVGDLSDFTWWLQGQQARVARRMGYFGAESEDENGYVVMADMVGREHLLNDYMSVENEGYDEWLYRENPSNHTTFRKIKHKVQPPYVEFMTPRENPYLESENGKIVNPETNDIIWYHGSWFGKLDRLKAYNPRQYYDATYFSSSEKLANEFATGEMAWLGYDEKVPRMKRSGYLHFVKIDEVKLLDPDKVFSDKEELLLTDEGIILVQTLSDLGVEDSEIEKWLKKFRRGRFHAFSKSNVIYPNLMEAMERLGYRGWFEREVVTPFYSEKQHINIALLHPDEDAKLVGGHIVKRTRKF